MKYTLSVLVENQPGVLSKVAGLFARRGFNIDSLAVGVTEHSDISRMTIVVNGDEYIVEQVEKQLNKVIPVIKVKVLQPEAFISRELSLIKVNCNTKQRLEIMQIAQLMNAGIVDVTTTVNHVFVSPIPNTLCVSCITQIPGSLAVPLMVLLLTDNQGQFSTTLMEPVPSM